MKTILISYGGPDRRIKDATGKVWRFEMHPHSGPIVQDNDGELADTQPGERSPFWVAINLWASQGASIGADGFCTWKPEPEPKLVHLGGRNYAVAGSALAKRFGGVDDEESGSTPCR
jgi:hypothetical protein